MLAAALDPAVIGDMVLHAIVHDEFYILSHSEFKEQVVERGRQLSESFDRWTTYRNEHGV